MINKQTEIYSGKSGVIAHYICMYINCGLHHDLRLGPSTNVNYIFSLSNNNDNNNNYCNLPGSGLWVDTAQA